MSPVADYSEYVNYAPGTFSLNPNGIGLGQGQHVLPGFSGRAVHHMTFDGIPFEEPPTRPRTTPGRTSRPKLDRFGRFRPQPRPRFELRSHQFRWHHQPLLATAGSLDPDIRGTASYGSFNTCIFQLDADSGLLRTRQQEQLPDGHPAVAFRFRLSNFQPAEAAWPATRKYQYRFFRTELLLTFSTAGWSISGPTRPRPPTPPVCASPAVRRQFSFARRETPFLSNGTPDLLLLRLRLLPRADRFRILPRLYTTDLGDGWKFDDRAYTTRYWNKQFYQNGTTVNLTPSKPSGVDKLNGYRHAKR